MSRPKSDNPTVKKTVSLDPRLLSNALKAAKQRGFSKSFSAYVAWLIERDGEGAVERESLRKKRGN